MKRKRSFGGLEADVLAILWASPTALTTGQVVDALDTGLAYTTVQTILARLLAKGAVQRQPAGRAHAYSPVLDQAGLAASRMHAMLDRGGDRAVVLSRFVGTLTAEEETVLAALLNDAARESGDQR